MGVARFRVVYACLQYGTRMLSLYVLVLFFFVSSVFVCLAFGSIINEVSDDTLTNIFNNILATQRHKITHTHTPKYIVRLQKAAIYGPCVDQMNQQPTNLNL